MTSAAALELGAFRYTNIYFPCLQTVGRDGVIKTEKCGVQKSVLSDKTPKKLLELAKGVMSDPIKRTIYAPKHEIHEKLLMSGYSALSEYPMMNLSRNVCFASDSISE